MIQNVALLAPRDGYEGGALKTRISEPLGLERRTMSATLGRIMTTRGKADLAEVTASEGVWVTYDPYFSGSSYAG